LGLSACFATICLGLASTGSGEKLYGGSVWAQVMATQWAHGIVWCFGMASIAEAISLDVIALPFGFILGSNIIGGWCTDLSNPGYQDFYQIFPFNWSTILMKHSYFGIYPTLVVRASTILITESIFFICLYFMFALKRISKTAAETNPEAVL